MLRFFGLDGFSYAIKQFIICLERMGYHFLHFSAGVLWHWSPERKLCGFGLVNLSLREQHNHVFIVVMVQVPSSVREGGVV